MKHSTRITVAKIIGVITSVYVIFLLGINALAGTVYVDDQRLFLVVGTLTTILLMIQTVLFFINSSRKLNSTLAVLTVLGTVASWILFPTAPNLFVVSFVSIALFIYVKSVDIY